MSKYTWRQIHFWIWTETTRGTKATTKVWMPKTSFDFDDKIETQEDEASLGSKIDISGIEVVKKYAEWSIEQKVWANSIGYFLNAILWNTTTEVVTASKVFSHLFKIKNDGNNPSLTIFTKEPNGDFSYPLALIESLTISAEVWNFITINVSFKSKVGETATHTATYWTDYQFKAKHSELKIADNEAWFTSAPLACIESFELAITKENLELFCLNNWNEPADILDWKIGITWSLTAVFSDLDYKNKALNDKEFAIYFALKDTETKIAGVTWKNPSLEFIIPKTKITDYGRDKSNDSIVKVNLSWKVYQNESWVEPIKVKLQNGVSTY